MAKLDEALSFFHDRVADSIKSGRSIKVTTHLDCDGITSGSIMTKSLIRSGASVTLQTVNEFSSDTIQKLKADQRDFHIITDLGGGFASELDSSLDDNWIIADHHQIPDEEYDNERVINAWKYGMDGGVEVSAGGMAYLLSEAMHRNNVDLAWIAVIAAIGDRQDQGEKKSFMGKNLEIATAAKEDGRLQIDMDILLMGRETRTIPDSLAFTAHPFIEGLTWNRDACLKLLDSSGIKLKEGNRWRAPAELTDEEKRILLEYISKYLPNNEKATDIVNEMVGYTYTLTGEDRRTYLRDAREFASLLNSCGRIRKSGVGIGICMGDRTQMLNEGENIFVEYRNILRNYMNILSSERWRMVDSGEYVIVNGEGLVSESMTGAVSSLLGGSPKNAGKLVILRTTSEDGSIKFSSRKSFGCESQVNLGHMMRNCASRVSGFGGGHDAAAGARISKDKLDEFLECIQENVAKVQSANISQ